MSRGQGGGQKFVENPQQRKTTTTKNKTKQKKA